MALASLPAAAALKALNDFLLTRSYIEGFTPSAADLVVLAAVGKADLSAYENVQRWCRHISSYSSAEQAKFPGEKKDISQYGPKAAVAAAPAAAAEAKEDEDDIDLFGSDDDEVDEEAEKLKQQRLEEYKAKKANKPKVIAKSSVVLDVKPWDDETDMKALEEGVRGVTMDGLLWGASKLVAVGFGIKKLQIGCVIEDDKVSTDELIEDHIMALEDYVQSVDIAAFQKI